MPRRFGCQKSDLRWAVDCQRSDNTERRVRIGPCRYHRVPEAEQCFRAPDQVLGFSCLGPAPRPYVLDNANAGGTIDLTMKWVTPAHLDVTYDRHPNLYFQVVKYSGINISVRDLSSEPANGDDSK